MECSKQLANIVKKLYKPGDKILDFGCASGHYYNSLKKIDNNLKYTGFDPTTPYIAFAKKFFKNNKNMKFDVQSLFTMNSKYRNKFDITFCSNVFHIPSIDVPLQNLIKSAKKYVVIRTLVSDFTHLSKFYYNDKTDKKAVLNNYVFFFKILIAINLLEKKLKN